VLIQIKKILPAKLRRLGLEKAVEFEKMRHDWDGILSAAVDPAWQKKSRPLKIKNEVLLVHCLNSVWANELQMKERIILEKIRKAFRNIVVERIKFIS